MKLIDLLNVMDKNTFVFVGVSVCGMQFETSKSVEFFINNGGELNNKKIMKAYMADGELHIRLED